ncbi:MAG: hypothetical protein RL114_725 [Actinomycetota bacterium]|jgi:uncharacterized membrane protein YhhN
MTSSVVLCIALASVFSVVDWWAVARNSKIVEYICKPAATIAFLVAAALISVDDSLPKTWRIIALVFCVFGDVFLMLPKDAFVPGLASFAIAQMCFVVSLATQDATTSKLIIGLLIVVPTTLFLSRRFITAIKSSGHGELVLPVAVYMVVIAAMATSAIAGGTAIGIAGAMFFLISDSLIAEHRFVKERGWQSVGIMVTYHVALAGLALGLL